MPLLGLTGYKKSGKDTVCDAIMQAHKKYSCVRIGFADALKQDICKMTGCTMQDIDAQKTLFRPLMQTYGSLMRDYRHKDYWVERAWKYFNSLPDCIHLVIIPDVRFLNEAKAIRDCGGKIFRIVRENNTDTHESEVEQDKIEQDDVIINRFLTLPMLQVEAVRTFHRHFPMFINQSNVIK